MMIDRSMKIVQFNQQAIEPEEQEVQYVSFKSELGDYPFVIRFKDREFFRGLFENRQH